MGTISRWMPPVQSHVVRWKTLGAILAGVIVLAFVAPRFRPVLLAMIVVYGVVIAVGVLRAPRDRRRLRALAAGRHGEDIGSFATSFRCAGVDMWIVRAVWDALEPWSELPEGRVPIRHTDRLTEDLAIDPEDLDDVIVEIAARCGRSLETASAHPLHGAVRTVDDLVRFIDGQPGRSVA